MFGQQHQTTDFAFKLSWPKNRAHCATENLTSKLNTNRSKADTLAQLTFEHRHVLL